MDTMYDIVKSNYGRLMLRWRNKRDDEHKLLVLYQEIQRKSDILTKWSNDIDDQIKEINQIIVLNNYKKDSVQGMDHNISTTLLVPDLYIEIQHKIQQEMIEIQQRKEAFIQYEKDYTKELEEIEDMIEHLFIQYFTYRRTIKRHMWIIYILYCIGVFVLASMITPYLVAILFTMIHFAFFFVHQHLIFLL